MGDEEHPERPRRTRKQPTDEADEARSRRRSSAAAAVKAAAAELAALTGRVPEAVTSVERDGEEWVVGIEVVESHRIPDSADIMALYEVRLDDEGTLAGFRRTHRYGRGQVQGGRR